MHTNPIIVHWNTFAYHFSYHPAFSVPDFACFCALLSIIARLLQCQNHELLTFYINWSGANRKVTIFWIC